MKQFEQQQIEHSKWRSRIDIATQGEGINPMAPFSQDVDERRGRVSSSEEVASQNPEPPVTASAPPHPEFRLATPGQQFGFRLPEAASQPESYTRAPTRTWFFGASSQPSSTGSVLPPSSQSPSVFSGGPLGSNSTAATSRTPSLCSSMSGRRLQVSGLRNSASQRPEIPHLDAAS